MLPFNLWGESFIFCSVYTILIAIPCVLVTIFGREMIEQLGRYPTKTPIIQMSIFWKLVVTEVVTFTLLITFFHVFSR